MSNYNYIKERRKELKMTQKELADKTNVTSAYIQQIENNIKKNPSIEVLIKIHQALNLDIYKITSESLKNISVSELFGVRVINKEKLAENNTIEESIMTSEESDSLMNSLITKAKINEKLKTIEEIKNLIINESENVLDDLRYLSNELDKERISIMFEINKLENK